MLRLAPKNDLFHAVAGTQDRARDLRRQRRSLGQAANRFQTLLPHSPLIGGDLLRRLQLLVLRVPLPHGVLDLVHEVPVHHFARLSVGDLFRRNIQVVSASCGCQGGNDEEYRDVEA